MLLVQSDASFVAPTGSFEYLSGSFNHIGSAFRQGNTIVTGSFAVSGSTVQIGDNTLDGLTKLRGNVSVLGNTTIEGTTTFSDSSTTVTGSFLISGSTTQIGDNTLDGNTILSGSVNIIGNTDIKGTTTFSDSSTTVTGSFLISGSTTQIGNNTLDGNTILSGSVAISGSTTQIGDNTLIGITSLTGSVNISGSLTITGETQHIGSVDITGSFEADLQENYVWLGDSNNRSTPTTLDTLAQSGSFVQSAYISCFSTSSISLDSANNEQTIDFTSIWVENGISLVDNNKFTFAEPGVYKLEFLTTIENDTNNELDSWFWIKLNGNNFPNSSTKVTVRKRKTNGEHTHQLVSISILGVAQTAGDYVQLYWTGENTALGMPYEGATVVHPATPSVTLNIIRVG
jgi:hypothetical protein